MPDDVKRFVDEEAAERGPDAASCLVLLAREALGRKADPRVDASLLEGLDSGPPIAADDPYRDEKHRRYRGRSRGEART